ncbi:MAG: DUF3313 domain-containing protein [Variovorax sp.]|nr:MAG: DUF3313 domain-containing protein [Variovorax sp.]
MKSRTFSRTLPACCAAVLALCAGCAGPGGGANVVASENTKDKVANVGFLSDPGRLKATAVSGGLLCWRQTGVDWKRYDKVMIERIQVYLKPTADQRPIDPTDLKTLLDYFHGALVRDLTPEAQIVSAAGPGVLRVRLALTSLIPTNTEKSLAGTAVPYGFVAEIGSGAATGRPAGSTPYMGQTGLEAQFRDGATGNVVGECADTEIGLKYAADLNKGASTAAEAWLNGYVSSFQSWSYAQDAFNKWSAQFARRFAELRSTPS